MSQAFGWDVGKNRLNYRKHGVSFEDAATIFDGPILTATDTRYDYGEVRCLSIGSTARSVVLVVVHTERRGQTRIISARRASRIERNQYYEHLKQKE